MRLIQYKFSLSNSTLFDVISELLFSHGAVAVDAMDAEDSPIFSTNEVPQPIWDNIVINSMFQSDDFNIKLLRTSLNEVLGNKLIDSVHEIIDQDWQKKWQQDTHPCEINTKLAIYPSHIKQPNSNQKIITLDPGLAFGTGSHPTTKMCLNWLSQNPISDLEIIDFGCGSGILSIASILFKAKSVLAIDNDQQALLATRANCQKNNITSAKVKTCSPEQIPNQKADLIIANIYLNVLIDIKDVIKNHLKKNGKVLLTGLLLEQKGTIMDKYTDFVFIEKHQYDDWAMVVAKKP